MRKFIKPAAFLLAVLMAATCAGCSSNKNSEAAGDTGGSTAKHVSLNFYYPAASQEDQNDVFKHLNDITNKKLNCTLNMKPTDWSTWSNKYPILLSSGEQIDLIYTSCDDEYFQEANKNSFLAIDSLLDKYGKDIKSNMQKGYLDAVKIKGKTFAIPVNKDMGQGWGLVVNKDMADKIGADFSHVKYLEDLEPIFAKAKASFPGVTPLFMTSEIDMRNLYATTKGCEDIGFRNHKKIVSIDTSNFLGYNVDTGKVTPFYDIPAFVDQCKLARSWFNKGYINHDTMTSQTPVDDNFKNGRSFATITSIEPGSEQSFAQEFGFPLETVELMPGIKDTSTLTGALTAIAHSSANPARAMMVINLAFSDKDFMNTFAYGVAGKQYEKESANVIKLPDGKANSDATGYDPGIYWEFGNNFNLFTWNNEDPKKWDNIKDYNEKLTQSDLLGYSVDSTDIKTEMSAHQNVLTEYNRLLMCGAADTDTTLSKMKTADNAAGIDKICSTIESQIKTWKASKK